MGKAEFEARFGFVPVMDVAKQKRRSVAKWLAEDKKWMEKHGFILIEAPAIPEMYNHTEMELAEPTLFAEPKKRGRKPKQS